MNDRGLLQGWFLEGLVAPGSPTWRTRVAPLPFSVGRRPGENLTLDSALVSGQHAQLFEQYGKLWIRDLDSTNGTFRNGERVQGEMALEEDDVVVFGDREFRVVSFAPEQGFRTTRMLSSVDSGSWLSHAGELQDQLNRGVVEVHLQPIRTLDPGNIVGYEVLGRGSLGGEPVGPAEMLATASLLAAIPRLCQAYRRQGLIDVVGEPSDVALLLNTHPEELSAPEVLLSDLQDLRREYPDRALILEIHEAATTEAAELKELGQALQEIRIDLAFDDFGTGRDRLMALAEAAPKLLKFDVAMIRSLDLVSSRRREMIRQLVAMVSDLGIAPLAECIETEGELASCREAGFEFGQGFLLGRPARFASGAWDPIR